MVVLIIMIHILPELPINGIVNIVGYLIAFINDLERRQNYLSDLKDYLKEFYSINFKNVLKISKSFF